jgi:carboxymethylenebutenolidase
MKVTRRFALAVLLVLGGAAFAQAVLPPLEGDAPDRLARSPRHGEWVTIDAGGGDKVDAFVVYPERADKAPVVLVVHEIFGLTEWARAVADQFAAEGFIAIAPDFLTGKGPDGKGSRAMTVDQARQINSGLKMAEVVARLNAAAKYGASLPASNGSYGVVGFCWGGGVSFAYATEQPDLKASVVYYGVSPATETLSRVNAPVLGLYGGDDARVDATVPAAADEMKRLGKSFEYEMFAGAGHAFLRQQDARNGANMKASEQAWPRTVQFLRRNLAGGMSMGIQPVPFIGAAAPATVDDDGCADACGLPQ